MAFSLAATDRGLAAMAFSLAAMAFSLAAMDRGLAATDRSLAGGPFVSSQGMSPRALVHFNHCLPPPTNQIRPVPAFVNMRRS